MLLVRLSIGEWIQIYLILVERIWSFVRISFTSFALTQSSKLSHNSRSCAGIGISAWIISQSEVRGLVRAEESRLVITGGVDSAFLLVSGLVLLGP